MRNLSYCCVVCMVLDIFISDDMANFLVISIETIIVASVKYKITLEKDHVNEVLSSS